MDNNLSQITSIDPNHKDLITHVEVDSDGTLMATTSVDKYVNIYKRKSRQEPWERVESLKTHGGYVSKCRFCHPFRGRILASCSFDTKIHVFQEDSTNRWKQRAVLNCNTAAVMDIQFCPYYLQNMLLAACTSVGHILVFEAPDPLNISTWNTLYELPLGNFRLSTLSWDRSRFACYPCIAVGSNDPNAGLENRLTVFEINYDKQMIVNKISLDFGSNDELVKCVTYAPSASPLYSRLAVATQQIVYIYVVLYEKSDKSESSKKYHLKTQPILTGKIQDDSSFEIVSILWNTQGSALSVQYSDGNLRVFQQMFNFCWKRTANVSMTDGFPATNLDA